MHQRGEDCREDEIVSFGFGVGLDVSRDCLKSSMFVSRDDILVPRALIDFVVFCMKSIKLSVSLNILS